MSTSPPSILPVAPIRTGFEAAARSHHAARAGGAVREVAAPRSGTPVEAAIARAAEQTSVDFGFLLAQAEVESAMDPDARARSSSATGLYQFIESTWLGTVRKHGSRFGLDALAKSIALTPSGSAYVADPGQREAILALRADPQIASLMAAGLAEDNRAHLAPILGRQPDHPELYLAHFLGAGEAGRFLSEMQADPSQNAAALFARPAAANRAIFLQPGRRSAQPWRGNGCARRQARTRARPRGRSSECAPCPQRLCARSRLDPHALSCRGRGRVRSRPAVCANRRAAARHIAARRASRSRRCFGAAFGNDASTAPAQVRRAYDRLKAFGL